MRDIMQYELPQPDLTVWEKTFLPTTSSKIKALLNGKYGVTSFASKPSEDGDMGFLEKNWFALHPTLTESSSSHPEVSWNSYHDMQRSSPPMRCPSYTLASTEQRERLEHASEEILDESASDEWPQIPSISDTILKRLAFGSSPQTTSWIASTIRRITNSLLDSGK